MVLTEFGSSVGVPVVGGLVDVLEFSYFFETLFYLFFFYFCDFFHFFFYWFVFGEELEEVVTVYYHEFASALALDGEESLALLEDFYFAEVGTGYVGFETEILETYDEIYPSVY